MPYATSDCNQYVSCMGCLMDAACGWCPISQTCEKRVGPMLSVEKCGSPGGSTEHYLVTDVGNCESCDVHVDCLSCAEVSSLNATTSAKTQFLYPHRFVYLSMNFVVLMKPILSSTKTQFLDPHGFVNS